MREMDYATFDIIMKLGLGTAKFAQDRENKVHFGRMTLNCLMSEKIVSSNLNLGH